jgi:hypothetical protein
LAALLDDPQYGAILKSFLGGEAILAPWALPSPANNPPFAGGPGLEDPGLHQAALGTTHGMAPLFPGFFHFITTAWGPSVKRGPRLGRSPRFTLGYLELTQFTASFRYLKFSAIPEFSLELPRGRLLLSSSTFS